MRDVFPCLSCNKGYKTRQALETHLFRSKKRCFLGDTPPGLESYCLTNNRAYCAQCNTCMKRTTDKCCKVCGLVLLYTNSNADPFVPVEVLLYTNCNADPFVPAENDLLTASTH